MITLIVGKNGKEKLFNELIDEIVNKLPEGFLKENDQQQVIVKSWLDYLELTPGNAFNNLNKYLSEIFRYTNDIRPLVVENIENYLHPKTQVEMGDLAILINRSRDSIWMTNSEHMILRLLRRIRETTENKMFNHPLMGQIKLTKNDIKIIHTPQNYELKIDDEGDFIDSWPEGFFNERCKELF